MADLRFEKPTTTEGYVALLADLGIMLPLDLCDEHSGSVIDAAGDEILVADPNSELGDDHARDIALAIILAVNTCGGFKAEVSRG